MAIATLSDFSGPHANARLIKQGFRHFSANLGPYLGGFKEEGGSSQLGGWRCSFAVVIPVDGLAVLVEFHFQFEIARFSAAGDYCSSWGPCFWALCVPWVPSSSIVRWL
jgi:hypothetical protein